MGSKCGCAIYYRTLSQTSVLPWLNDQVAKLILISPCCCWKSIQAMLLLRSTNEFANIFAYYALSWVRGRCRGSSGKLSDKLCSLCLSSACQVTVTGQRSSPTHWQCHCYLNCSSFFNPPQDMSWLIRQLLLQLPLCHCLPMAFFNWNLPIDANCAPTLTSDEVCS